MIIQNNEAALRVECQDVKPEEVGELRELLERELAHSARMGRVGIGLACSQIGVPKRMAIVRLDTNGISDLNLDLVNADIVSGYDAQTFMSEGCLSFPGRVENTTRFQEIHIENNLVNPSRFIATGMLAVVCQHENDHMTGKLFFDHSLPKPKLNKKIGVNEPCICGSGVKYKKCCLKNQL